MPGLLLRMMKAMFWMTKMMEWTVMQRKLKSGRLVKNGLIKHTAPYLSTGHEIYYA